jgi:molybdate transport system regulatory protein
VLTAYRTLEANLAVSADAAPMVELDAMLRAEPLPPVREAP